MNSEPDESAHRWPDEEPSQRVKPKLSRYQRVVRFMQGAFALGMVDRSLGSPRNQDPMRNVIGIGMSADASRRGNSVDDADD